MLVAKDLEKFICELEPVCKCNVRMTQNEKVHICW